MSTWRSWSGAVRATPAASASPATAEEVAACIRRAAASGRVVRVAGSGRSSPPIAASDDVVLSLDRMPADVEVAPDGRSAVVGAGMAIRALNRALAASDLALAAMGGSDHQAVAGALSTGTHGTGGAVGPMHTMVEGVELVDGRGELRWVAAEELPAARLALGSLGVLTRVRLAVVPAYRLAATVAKVPLEDVLADFDHHVADHRHAGFSWLPWTPWCQLELADATDEPAAPDGVAARVSDVVLENAAVWAAGQVARTFPGASAAVSRLLAAGITDGESRRDSARALASVPRVRVREMAYALPRTALADVMAGLDALIRDQRLPVALPVEVRAVAADDTAWLSPAGGRDTLCVAVRSVRGMPYTAYFRAAQELFRSLGGRPHWGTVHTLGSDDLRPLYPRWDDFQAVRAAADPAGVLTSPDVRRILGDAAAAPAAGARG